ncbi:hypothetical protein [Ruegeria hyattellae]|uniref:hypothetical protein n=1 Tax=Ruegeria hyattellae TaxID=3233337 RepID=UPI00355C71B5
MFAQPDLQPGVALSDQRDLSINEDVAVTGHGFFDIDATRQIAGRTLGAKTLIPNCASGKIKLDGLSLQE